MVTDIRLLSVDDEKDFTELLRGYLEPRGFEMATAADGAEALALAGSFRFDVALLDLKMEGLSGDEVMDGIWDLDRATEVIFISAYNDEGRTKKALLGRGAFAYFEKPVESLRELEKAILEAAGSSKKRGGNA